MDTDTVRTAAEEHAKAMVAGDLRRASQDLSDGVKAYAQDVMKQLPWPVTEAHVESVETARDDFLVRIRYVGENNEGIAESRWSDQEGRPIITELKAV